MSRIIGSERKKAEKRKAHSRYCEKREKHGRRGVESEPAFYQSALEYFTMKSTKAVDDAIKEVLRLQRELQEANEKTMDAFRDYEECIEAGLHPSFVRTFILRGAAMRKRADYETAIRLLHDTLKNLKPEKNNHAES